MSGWDEGRVFYSDQAATEDEHRDDEDGTMTRFAAKGRLKEFLRSFHDPRYNDQFIYRERLQRNPSVLEVDVGDLAATEEDLNRALRSNPGDILPLLESAAAEVASSMRSKVLGESGELEDAVMGDVQVLLKSTEDSISIRQLDASHISKLVKVPGIVIAASRAKAKATVLCLACKSCGRVKELPVRPGLSGVQIPRTCDRAPQAHEEACPVDPFVVVPSRSKYMDQQTLKMQEKPEDVPTGEMPRSAVLVVDRSLVQKIVPGMRVTVYAIFSVYQPSGDKARDRGSRSMRGAVAVRQPYLRVVGLEHSEEGNARSTATFSAEEEADFREFSRQQDPYQQICARIAPSIFGHQDVKKAVACLLFGGSRKILPDGAKLRGDINVLLIGDPSTAKSQFLKFVEKTAPIAVYTSGKGSSAAGLTASVIRDPNTREFYLEGGAMVLADGGVVCIDEFDKMRPEDRVAIHEAMEQQTISIAKAGITTVLNSRTSVLAAANPPSGRYDDLKSAQENIDLQTTILSRFDLIFIVKDTRDFDRDMQIARHVVGVHATAEAVQAGNAAEAAAKSAENWLKRYVEFARNRVSPRLTESASKLLVDNYVRIRQDMRKRTNETGEATAVPITVRQLEAIVRLSESLARMQLSNTATEEHVTEALRLFNVATLDAAQSGMMDSATFTEEQKRDIQHIEVQVRRKIGIGSFMSERKLIDELARFGFGDSIVRRALLALVGRGELEYKRERRILFRKV